MKVSELVEQLQKLPQDQDILIADHNDPDYCYRPFRIQICPALRGEPPIPPEHWYPEDYKNEDVDEVPVIWFKS